MEEKFLKLKKKDLKRMKRAVAKAAGKSDLSPRDLSMSLAAAFEYLNKYNENGKARIFDTDNDKCDNGPVR